MKKKTKIEKELQVKRYFLESYFSSKNKFLDIEKLIANDFQKYSLNQILEFKIILKELYDDMEYFIKVLKKYHKIDIDIEDRSNFTKIIRRYK